MPEYLAVQQHPAHQALPYVTGTRIQIFFFFNNSLYILQNIHFQQNMFAVTKNIPRQGIYMRVQGDISLCETESRPITSGGRR